TARSAIAPDTCERRQGSIRETCSKGSCIADLHWVNFNVFSINCDEFSTTLADLACRSGVAGLVGFGANNLRLGFALAVGCRRHERWRGHLNVLRCPCVTLGRCRSGQSSPGKWASCGDTPRGPL